MSCVFSVMGCTRSPQRAQMKTVGCKFKYKLCCYIHAKTCMNKTTLRFALSIAFIMCIYFSAWCLHVPAHKWFLHVGLNGYLMCPGSVVCLGIAASVLGSSPPMGFYPSSWPRRSLPIQTVCWAFLTVLLRSSYSTRHVLFIICCHELSEATMKNAAFLFMKRPCWRQTSNHHYHPVLCTCTISFVGMQHHNSKTGGCFIFRIKGIQIRTVMLYEKS